MTRTAAGVSVRGPSSVTAHLRPERARAVDVAARAVLALGALVSLGFLLLLLKLAALLVGLVP